MYDGPVAPLAQPPGEVAYTFVARFPGRCAECDEDIHEGDQLARLTDDSIVHEDCTP